MSLRLFESVQKGEVENLRCLLECGGNVLAKDSNDSNLLHIAVISKQLACAELLIKQAPQLALEKNSWGRTPLICACTPVVSLEMMRVLVKEKASLEIADDDCRHRPLHFGE
jgi:ankyrin repeat protein